MQLRPLTPALGTAVEEVDLRRPLDAKQWADIQAAFRRSHLVVFPEQDLDDGQHVEVAGQFGPVAREGFGDAASAVGFVSNHRPDGTLGSTAASWHIDYGFFEHPYEALSLYGLEIPEGGTQTRFVSAVAAARSLPADLRRRVEGRQARHIVDVTSPAGQTGVRVRLGRLDDSYPHTLRPVLWPHHATGDTILGVWEQQTDAVLPMAADDSTALIEALFAHLYRPDHVYVHDWRPGDLVVWDNHAVQHARPDVGVEHPRTLRRVCIGQEQDLSIFAAMAARTATQAAARQAQP